MSNATPTLIEVLNARARRLDEPCQAKRRAVIEAVAEDIAPLGDIKYVQTTLHDAYIMALGSARRAQAAAGARPDSLRRRQLAADALDLAIRMKALMIEEGET